MSHWVHGVEWFEARGEVLRGWVWELADRRRRDKELLERLALGLVEKSQMPPDSQFAAMAKTMTGHKVYR